MEHRRCWGNCQKVGAGVDSAEALSDPVASEGRILPVKPRRAFNHLGPRQRRYSEETLCPGPPLGCQSIETMDPKELDGSWRKEKAEGWC